MAATQKQEATKPEAKTATPREAMSLQEKFIKLREAVPAITQKQHSDGVKYKFAKIFDVYELLTPAMNLWGVNFDIVAETATRHAQNGDNVYYHSYDQQTKNGPRTVWVYEADLTLRWTNADDPDDVLEVTLHAIGTNDGGPDKAKGSAWTYCLKYYLFEKFGIDQGDDDPDMKDLSGTEMTNQKPQNGQNAPQGRNTQPPAQNSNSGHSGASRGLSDAQLNRMYKKAEDAGITKDSANAHILQKYGQQDPHNLTRPQYDEVCAALDAQKKQGGQDHA